MIAERQVTRIVIEGAVQGVGFRPFVFRLAHELGLNGFVSNTSSGVVIELDGDSATVEHFINRLYREKPPLAVIDSLTSEAAYAAGYSSFEICLSQERGSKTALVLPDIATCPDCLNDISDPHNRRYRYPFTNCTNCGPRYSIIRALPYDRACTSMRQFDMCPACRAEYEDPRNRRFHAQPNACPVCGPHLELWDRQGRIISTHDDALLQAAAAIRAGQIVALKGIGGFQLLVDARNVDAVQQLRERKHRPAKPFALMFPSLAMIREQCLISSLEADLLTSPGAPIVLLRAKNALVAQHVAPGNPNLGVMLPYTPLHHLFMAELDFPVVATSGNRTSEPICIDEHEALARLSGIADLFLTHDRPIVRQVDDSVVRVVAGELQILRRARGYAPLPIHTRQPLPKILAVGGHLKNTIAASSGSRIFVSQHIGDLDSEPALAAFERTIRDFRTLYDWSPDVIAHDAHPDYRSTYYAAAQSRPTIAVQHHYAHLLACMAEHQVDAPILGVCWDGTGYGTDGTIWGGEWLLINDAGFERVAHLRSFCLPGGDRAVQEPRRAALGLLYKAFGESCVERLPAAVRQSFSPQERTAMLQMLRHGVNAPVTSSMGRLFDAVAALLNLHQTVSFEGQAAMALEAAAADSSRRYSFGFDDGMLDWEPMLRRILDDLDNGIDKGEIAAKFHNTLVDMVLAVARRIGERFVVLSGGCFQNKYLLEATIDRLWAEGLTPYWPQQVPPNDGGIALGQVMAAAREYRSE
ncbi:MAG: carbamoyltransferase HypF [Anaerolineaceae bacterium]|nr:carbamoyltransferase HypF [Anaerolineaceae bacterium]